VKIEPTSCTKCGKSDRIMTLTSKKNETFGNYFQKCERCQKFLAWCGPTGQSKEVSSKTSSNIGTSYPRPNKRKATSDNPVDELKNSKIVIVIFYFLILDL
jgi:hypothetical protein